MRRIAIFAALIPAILLLAGVVFVAVRVQHSLTDSRVQVSKEGQLAFDFGPLALISNLGFEPLGVPNIYKAGAVFQGKLYLAGPGGLAEYPSLTAQPRLLRIGLDLPPAPIIALATGMLRGDLHPQLILATSGEGVLWYDGAGFRQLRPRDATGRDVTALLPLASGDLLIGTRSAGLLLFDGKTLVAFHPRLAMLNVTALAGDEGDFWVGTRNRGIFHWHAGQLDSFDGSSDDGSSAGNPGLPDPQVDAIALAAGKAYVGTPVGVEEFDDGHPARTLAPGFFAHALYTDGNALTIASIDSGIREIALAPRHSFRVADEQPLQAEGFFANDGLFAVGRYGVFRRTPSGGWSRVLETAPSTLTDSNIAALGFAPDGRLWIGYFDRGLDILSVDSRRAQHVEDDHVFCINRIITDSSRNTVDVATANGLVIFDVAGRERQVLLRRDGLIADQVTDISVTHDETVIATPAGLTFIGIGGTQSLYAFHGLVNNHVYSLAQSSRGHAMLAGTLGGVSILEAQSVRRNLTSSNSGLKHNWTTAIVPVDDGWFVGTYGAGVMHLDAAGHFTPMEGVGGPIEINPNAMLVTAANVFAGSLREGLFVYDRVNEHWSRVTAGLPSFNVTALAEHDGSLYVGTDNGVVRIAEARMSQ
jgi:ligand-binding sensor domain-containing protein